MRAKEDNTSTDGRSADPLKVVITLDMKDGHTAATAHHQVGENLTFVVAYEILHATSVSVSVTNVSTTRAVPSLTRGGGGGGGF